MSINFNRKSQQSPNSKKLGKEHTARSDTILSHTYLLTCEVDLFEVLEIMAQMWHYIIFLAINQQR